MPEKKRPLVARILGGATYYVFDNLMMIAAVVSLLLNEWHYAIGFTLFAFYDRATEIRDAVRGQEVQINLNGSGPTRLKDMEV